MHERVARDSDGLEFEMAAADGSERIAPTSIAVPASRGVEPCVFAGHQHGATVARDCAGSATSQASDRRAAPSSASIDVAIARRCRIAQRFDRAQDALRVAGASSRSGGW